MRHNQETTMPKLREDRVKELGIQCYNLYCDSEIWDTAICEKVSEISNCYKYLSYLRDSNLYYDCYSIEEKLIMQIKDLGCMCYNSYVDHKLIHYKMLLFCDMIFAITQEIEKSNNSFSGYYSSTDTANTSILIKEKKYTTHSKLKITYPEGMEPIPTDFKMCVCGYRNKPSARFCGRCGAKLS